MQIKNWWVKFSLMCFILYSTKYVLFMNISSSMNALTWIVGLVGWLLFLELWRVDRLRKMIAFSIFCFSQLGISWARFVIFDLDIRRMIFEGMYVVLVIYGLYEALTSYKKKEKL